MVIIGEHGYRRVRARWVPNMFTVKHITARETSVRNFSRAVRRTEILFCQEQLSVMNPGFIISTHWRKDHQWNGIISRLHATKKFKVQTSAGKVTASLFEGSEGTLLMEFLETDVTVNSKRQVQTVQKLKQWNRKDRSNMKMNQFFLLHDNASPHTSLYPREAIETMGCTGLPHPP